MNYRIRFLKGELEGKCFSIQKDSLSIGRSSKNDVVLHLEDISRRHVILALGTEGIAMENLSAKKTSVDGKAIPMGQKSPLGAGQTVVLGTATEFLLEAYEDDEAPQGNAPPDMDMGSTRSMATEDLADYTAAFEPEMASGFQAGSVAGTRSQLESTTAPPSQLFTSGNSTTSSPTDVPPTRKGKQNSWTGWGKSKGTASDGRADEATGAASASQTVDMQTRMGTPEEIEDIRRGYLRNLRVRNALFALLVMAFIYVVGMVYYLFHKSQEKNLGWPLKDGVISRSKLFDLEIPRFQKAIFISYPVISQTAIDKEKSCLSIRTGIGRYGQVPFFITVEHDSNPQLLKEERRASLERWMQRKAQGSNAWNFEVPIPVPKHFPVRFWSNHNGVPYLAVPYTRQRDGLAMFGHVWYFRCEDTEIAVILELPASERWRGEGFLKESMMRFTLDTVTGHWEGMAELDILPVKEELREAEKLLDSASPSAWSKVEYMLTSALCKIDRDSESQEYRQALKLLRKLRKDQEIWFNSQRLSFYRAKSLEDKAEQGQIRRICQGVFSSREDRRHNNVRTNNWN